jgi:hypothetical protein
MLNPQNNFFIPLKYFFAFFLRARRYTAHAGQASAQKNRKANKNGTSARIVFVSGAARMPLAFGKIAPG